MSNFSLNLKLVVVTLLSFVGTIFMASPAKAQCSITGYIGGGYCYDWGHMFSGKTIRIYSSGGKSVQAATPWGTMYGEWVGHGNAVLDAGDQYICCYGKKSTGQMFGYCNLC